MRLSKDLISLISERIASNLEAKELAEYDTQKTVIIERIVGVITANMTAEDALNKDVEKILSAHEAEIKRGQMDYRKVFELTKQKLAKDRGMVL